MDLSQLCVKIKDALSKFREKNYRNSETDASKVVDHAKVPGESTPHGKRGWLVSVLTLLIVAAALYFILRPKQQTPQLPTVEVEEVTTSSVNLYGEYVGRIRAQQFVEIHARVEGYLENMLFKEGSYIQKGQT